MVPRAINDLFTGRVELLARMQQALRHEITSRTSKQRRFVITGLGGQGKSEVCLQVANLVREEYVLLYLSLPFFVLTVKGSGEYSGSMWAILLPLNVISFRLQRLLAERSSTFLMHSSC